MNIIKNSEIDINIITVIVDVNKTIISNFDKVYVAIIKFLTTIPAVANKAPLINKLSFFTILDRENVVDVESIKPPKNPLWKLLVLNLIFLLLNMQ